MTKSGYKRWQTKEATENRKRVKETVVWYQSEKKSKIGIYKIDDKLKLKEVHATYTCKQNESDVKIVGKEEMGLL